jgi:hypothetical protein
MSRHAEALRKTRAISLALPETNERLSHGAPTFFIRDKKTFVTFVNDHHSDGRLALWCAAPPDMQETLVAGGPDHYFVPPYVGHRGWVGVRLDRGIEWDEVAGVIEDAYVTVAPKTVLRNAGLT